MERTCNNAQSLAREKIRSLLKGESQAVRFTYGYLRYVDKDKRGFAYPAQATIARAVKMSPRHVIRCLARLETLDLIIRGKKAQHSYYIFTLPSALKDTKSPLEANLEAITQEVKDLKERALKAHLDKEKPKVPVTPPCHTNRIKIKNKIKAPDLKGQSNPKPKREAKESACVPKKPDWFEWIEEKKSLRLTQTEKDLLEEKEQEILSQREKRFKGFPQPFVVSYVKEIALTWVLKAHRGLRCTGEDCLLEKEIERTST